MTRSGIPSGVDSMIPITDLHSVGVLVGVAFMGVITEDTMVAGITTHGIHGMDTPMVTDTVMDTDTVTDTDTVGVEDIIPAGAGPVVVIMAVAGATVITIPANKIIPANAVNPMRSGMAPTTPKVVCSMARYLGETQIPLPRGCHR